MDPEDQVLEAPVVDDRRATIEAAFEAEEAPNEQPAAKELAAEKVIAEPAAKKPAIEPAPKPAEVQEDPDKPAPHVNIDKAPQSWRAPQKLKWDKLDPDVRQEVMRREKEITRTLGETAEARSFTNRFHAAVQPYQARIQSLGVSPMQAAAELFKADHILTTAPPAQRAAFMAKLIKDYGVDVRELDSALAGGEPADPIAATVEQLLQQRLAPFQQYIAQQEQMRQAGEQRSTEQASQTIEQMAEDPKYPHFQDLREDMADIIDLSAKRGIYLTLPQAYTRAIAMNPELSQQQEAERQQEQQRQSALGANARAQKALQASKSVSGAPSGGVAGASVATDRRAAIAAALDDVAGR